MVNTHGGLLTVFSFTTKMAHESGRKREQKNKYEKFSLGSSFWRGSYSTTCKLLKFTNYIFWLYWPLAKTLHNSRKSVWVKTNIKSINELTAVTHWTSITHTYLGNIQKFTFDILTWNQFFNETKFYYSHILTQFNLFIKTW